jgi:hypothetical protein
MRNKIVLPAGTEYIATSEIPELITRALHPDVTELPLTVSYFIKFARRGATGETANWNGWPIDDDDREVLAHLWADLPPLPDHATADEVKPYLEKANSSELDWTLDVCWNNPQLNSSIIRPEAEKEHRQAIVAAIRRGDLKVVAPHTRLATDEYHPNSQVSLEELRRYVEQFKIVLRLESHAEARRTRMESQFPQGVDRVSVWRMACQLAGQNPIEISPSAETLNKLQQICAVALKHGGIEWASVSPDRPPIFRLDGADAMALIAQMASRPDAMTDWQAVRCQLTLIDVRRDYWERYGKALANDSTQGTIDVPDQSTFYNAGTVLPDEEPLRITNGGVVSNLANDWVATEDMNILVGTFDGEVLDEEPQNIVFGGGAMRIVDQSKTVTADNPHMPDWNVWSHALKATLREAVSLSCDTDPKVVALGPVENIAAQLLPLPVANKEVCSEIARRLAIARSHVGTGGTLPTVTGDNDGDVYLATFAEWALNTMKWAVPDELRALVDTTRPVGAPDKKTRGKLTNEQRAQIVERAKQGEVHQKLADEFGVKRQHVSKLVKDALEKTATWMPSVATKRR